MKDKIESMLYERFVKARFLHKLRQILQDIDPSATLEDGYDDIILVYRDGDDKWHFIPLGPRVTVEAPK